MSKVMTFSRVFPEYHPKAGQPTHFVEKILLPFYGSGYLECEYASKLQDLNGTINGGDHTDALALWSKFWDLTTGHQVLTYKHHTIRAGNRWKVGDRFSPRVWSGKPYKSKQIIIAPDLEVKKVWEVEIVNQNLFVDGRDIYTEVLALANNDGLTFSDLMDWFNKPFKGQIICWEDNINY